MATTNRREFLKLVGAGIAGLAIGSAATYAFTPRGVVEKIVERTVTSTATVTPQTSPRITSPVTPSIPSKPIELIDVDARSGPGAPFTVPAINARKMAIDEINSSGGILGRKINYREYDENQGSPDAVARLIRSTIEQYKPDLIVGLGISSDCLAVAPVVNELNTLTFVQCATNQLLQGGSMPKYKTVFRPIGSNAALDAVGLAYYVAKRYPNIKRVAGINQDYAYGRDEWNFYITSLNKLKPDIEVVNTWWVPLGTSDFRAHISQIMQANPDLLQTSIFGSDAVNFMRQAIAAGLPSKIPIAYAHAESLLHLVPEMPDGIIIQAAGPAYPLYPPPNIYRRNASFINNYRSRYNDYPHYSSYYAYDSIYTYKYAVERAYSILGKWPDIDDLIKVLEELAFEGAQGLVYINKDHDTGVGSLVGVTKRDPRYPFVTLDPNSIELFPGYLVTPPPGIPPSDWINSW
jgi:branched-chain amino acid transport system substrate-binding protein